jgi:hypothetical protein
MRQLRTTDKRNIRGGYFSTRPELLEQRIPIEHVNHVDDNYFGCRCRVLHGQL